MPRPAHRRRRRTAQTRRRLGLGAVMVVAVVVGAVLWTVRSPSSPLHVAGAGHRVARTGPAGSTSTTGTPAMATPTTETPTTAVATTSTTSLSAVLPPPDAGSLPPTDTEPSYPTATFGAEMTVLWQAVQTDDPAVAMPAFFPEAAYAQLKALDDDDADWTDRLVAHFDLDVAAAHRLLGPDPAAARLVQTLVPSAQAAWIPPGDCYNRLGYWHLPGSRMVYEVHGQEQSFGIASLISWRGDWYVVHLGAVYPPAGEGVVDDPASGTGSYGGPGGC